ncbi:hypothetical protein C8034_v006387 [Colletotrichum sidae]|uniref:Uncharacterized protein n=1 Tax=Colletotrichum sidae TaxID=1347389 RepID=A0A4R8T6H7_9PEZI|nr:hypothetical protein C8034_v006387 [Colletotrichum sidae]
MPPAILSLYIMPMRTSLPPLDAAWDPALQTEDGEECYWTPLQLAARGGEADKMRNILAANPAAANKPPREYYGQTAIQAACIRGHEHVVQILIRPELISTFAPLEGASASIWHCNAASSYASFTGIDLDTSERLDGWYKRADGTTDDEVFLRGVQISDAGGMIEFLTKFPGAGTSYNQSTVQHVGQLFFEEDLLGSVYAASPEDGYSPFISVSLLGDGVEDGLVEYITIGVKSTGDGIATTGTDVNPQGWISTVSVGTEKIAQATAADRATGYTS